MTVLAPTLLMTLPPPRPPGLPASATAAATTLPPAQVAKLWQAAQDFEAMAIGQFLTPMFDTVDLAHSAFGGGDAEQTIQPLLIDAMGKQIAADGGLGLAAPVFASMLRTQEAAGQGGTMPRTAARGTRR